MQGYSIFILEVIVDLNGVWGVNGLQDDEDEEELEEGMFVCDLLKCMIFYDLVVECQMSQMDVKFFYQCSKLDL